MDDVWSGIRAAQVNDIFKSTSDMVWGALPPDAQASRLPAEPEHETCEPEYNPFIDYGEAFWDENYTSKIGPDWGTEWRGAEDDVRAGRSSDAEDYCNDAYQARAAVECRKGKLPGGLRTDLRGEDCMRIWAEGIPGGSDTSGSQRTSTTTYNNEGGLEVGGQLDGVAGKGSYKHAWGGATSDTNITSATRNVTGLEGYQAKCARESEAWFEASRKAASPYAD